MARMTAQDIDRDGPPALVFENGKQPMAILFALHLALMADRSPAPKLSGGFIQLSNAAMNLKRDDWLAVCDAMKAIGFETILIQSVEYVGNDGVPYAFFEHNGVDPIAEILRHAETRGMKVFIGLRLDQKWDQIRKGGTAIDKLLSVNRSTADQVWARYGPSTAFGGFYILQELANYAYSDAEIDLLKR